MSKLPEPRRRNIATEIRKDRDRERRRNNSSPFSGTGMSVPSPGVVSMDGSLEVGGTLNVTGNTVIGGTLSLPAGIIDNDALANPVTADINGASAIGDSVSTTSTVKATTTIVVPAGFTKAIVRADAIGQAVNSTASPDYIYVDANINSITGGEMYNAVASGFGGGAQGVANRIVSGLSGGDIITCTAMSRTSNAGWAANAANQWTIHAQAIFMR